MFHFASFFCFSLSNSLKKQHLPIKKCSFQMFHLIFITFSWYLRHFAPKGQICHSDIFRGLRICISMMSVGLINPFQKFREVFICFAEFPEYCSNPFALVSPFKALPRCTNKPCSTKGLPRWDPESVQLWVLTCASCIEDPPYEKGCRLRSVGIFQLNKSEKPSQLFVCI